MDALSDVRFAAVLRKIATRLNITDGAEESARAKVTCAQRLRRAELAAAPSFDGAADGRLRDQEGTLKGVALRGCGGAGCGGWTRKRPAGERAGDHAHIALRHPEGVADVAGASPFTSHASGG